MSTSPTPSQSTPPTPALRPFLPPLRDYRKNVHSQFGEDGVIEEIFRRLGIDTKPDPLWCVEFGAWDGVHLSNTRRLIEQRPDTHAVLIEGSAERTKELVENNKQFENVIPLNRMVGWGGPDSIFKILQSTPLPEYFDLLSVDVDGHDYWIWRSLTSYRATVVVIEYNQTIPYRHLYIPPYDTTKRHGCSLLALEQLGAEKGYKLAAVTDVNAIFVDDSRFDELRLERNDIDTLTAGLEDYRTFVFQLMDGTLELAGRKSLVWHETPIDPVSIQTLPKTIRQHPDGLGRFGQWLLNLNRKRSLRRIEKGER